MSTQPFSSVPPPAEPVGYAKPPSQPRSGMAIAALVCGILGVVFTPICAPVGIVGLVLGIIATVRANREPMRYGGKGLAIAGICTGGASVLVLVFVVPMTIAILLPSLSRAREITKRAVDASNLRGLGQSVLVYAQDHGGAFPPDFQTLLADGSITAVQLLNPCSGNAPPQCDYSYVAGLTTHDSGRWILAFSDPAYHGGEGANILYLDGTVQFVKEQPNQQFQAELDCFKKAYQESRGSPPVIVAPR